MAELQEKFEMKLPEDVTQDKAGIAPLCKHRVYVTRPWFLLTWEMMAFSSSVYGKKSYFRSNFSW